MIFAKERYTYRPDLFPVYNNRRRPVKRIATYGKKSGTNGKLHRLFRGEFGRNGMAVFPLFRQKRPAPEGAGRNRNGGFFTEPLFR